ncbi:MAG: hypothetical protein H6632_02415 [Anaerolineales bacterium]|nr:hypothetical protein [Anaerolineales bacterium]
MLKIIVDTISRFHVVLPDISDEDGLLTQNDEFLTYDATLPPEDRSVFTRHLIDLREQCVPHHEQFYSSEAQRSIASDNTKRFEEEITQHLKQAQHNLTARYWQTPAEAEAWGFEVKQTTGNIIFPGTKSERMRVLNRYISKEQSRPEEERFATPDLARLIEVREQLLANRKLTSANRKQRKSSRIARDEAFRRLRETLRMAAGNIIILQFDHTITPDLQKWGFEVIERSSSKPDETEYEEVIILGGKPEASSSGTVSTNGEVSLTGLTKTAVQTSTNGN